MIELININLDNVSENEQCKKVQEEESELRQALIEDLMNDTLKNKEHIMEEFWDVVQANLGLLQKHGIIAWDVMNYYPKHLEKIKNRPRKKEK